MVEDMKLLNEDCLSAMRRMPDETIDMIYLDPPFFTQKEQLLRDKQGCAYQFSDRWDSKREYLSYLQERLLEMKRLLKETGTIFLHCDRTMSHYLRMLLDEVFGEENFQSEIIWSYKRWSNSKKGLLPGHQTIFLYSKSERYKFNTIYKEYSATTNVDQILQERVKNENGKAAYRKDEKGNIILGKEKQGVPLSDVWEIPFLNPKAKERTGYPTQKPLELLERIVKISTDEGDWILDPFCGSGTTLVAAKRLGRNAVGMDLNRDAIALCEQRLERLEKTESKVLQVGEKAYRTKTEQELAILKQFDCNIVQRNCGIDAILKKYYLDAPVALKIQKESETVMQAAELLKKAAEKKNCSFSILVIRNPVEKSLRYRIPANMILLERYELNFEQQVELQLEQMGYNQKKA